LVKKTTKMMLGAKLGPYAVAFSVVCLLLPSSGCGVYSEVADFVHVKYQNVVGYFNTLYNAERVFDEALEDIAKSQEQMPLNLKGLQQSLVQPPVPVSKEKLDVVIEKCSRLLQYYPDSKWVDDALLLIGKAYFYQTEYLKAERKFLELITQFPNSNLSLPAKLWLGKSLLKSGKRDEALAALEDVTKRAMDSGDEDLVAEAHSTVGEFYIAREEYARAIPEFESSVQVLGDGPQKGRAQFFIGELYREIGKPDTAAKNYLRVTEYTSDYRLRFNALLQYGVLQRNLKHLDLSLAVLRDLMDDNRNFEFFPQIRLELANSLNARGDLEEAIAQYQYVDTTFKRTDVSAKGYYALGYLLEKKKGDYKQAAECYEKSRNEFANSDITPLATERSGYLQSYLNFVKTLNDKDSVLTRLLQPDSLWVVDSSKLPVKGKIDSSKLFLTSSKKAVPDSSVHSAQDPKLDDKAKELAVSDSLVSLSNARFDSLQSPRQSVSKTDSVVQIVADSLRKSPKAAALNDSSNQAGADSSKITGPPKKKVPGTIDSATVADVRRGIGDAIFGLAELFFLQLDEPDSAVHWYSRAIKEFPKGEFIPTALYSLASLYRTRGTDSSQILDSLYRRIVKDYPKSGYANDARKALGIPPLEEAPDTSMLLYSKGDSLLSKEKILDAIAVFRTIITRYPKSHYAARAQYAIGWVYENIEVRFDSAANNYRRLLKDFPNSKYASLVRDKVAEVDASLKETPSKPPEAKASEQKKPDSTSAGTTKMSEPSQKGPEQITPKPDDKNVDTLEQESARRRRSAIQDTTKKPIKD
jgi:TolA-binding protein